MANFALWPNPDNYQRFRQIMDDGQKFPANFEEWEKTAKRQMADAKDHGVTIEASSRDKRRARCHPSSETSRVQTIEKQGRRNSSSSPEAKRSTSGFSRRPTNKVSCASSRGPRPDQAASSRSPASGLSW